MAGRGTVLFLSCAGMFLSWLYVWPNFLIRVTCHRSFPPAEALGFFALAAAITAWCRGRGWRVVSVGSLHLLGFCLCCLRTVHVFFCPSRPFLSREWVVEFFTSPHQALEWVLCAFVLVLTCMFWAGGVAFGKRPSAYGAVCSRFDLGVALFFLLFLTRFMVMYRGGVAIPDPASELLLFPFFVCSLFAMGLARNRDREGGEFLPGYGGIGVILSFSAVVFLVGAAMVLVFLPYLTAAADTAYVLLAHATAPLGTVLVGIIRFLFGNRDRGCELRSAPGGGADAAAPAPGEHGWWTEFLEAVVTVAAWGLLGIMTLVICGLAGWVLVRWLLSKTPAGERTGKGGGLLVWMERLRAVLALWWDRVILGFGGLTRASRLYGALVRWGRRSGLPLDPAETPLEYGARLAGRFPALRSEVCALVSAFNREVYAETALSEQERAGARSAWRRLIQPGLWPCRLKSRLLRKGEGGVTKVI